MTSRQVGACCVGKDKCLFQSHELNPEHKCVECGEIVHVMCAEWVDEKEGHKCKNGCRKNLHHSANDESEAVLALFQLCQPVGLSTTNTLNLANTEEIKEKKCRSCGGTDHQRISSKLCKLNKKRVVKIGEGKK